MFEKDNGFKIGIIGVILILAIVYFAGKDSGKTEMENKMYKQIVEEQMLNKTL